MALALFCACSKDNSITLKEVDDVCTMMDDLTFMKYCLDNFDVNKDGKVSMSEAEAVRSMSVNWEEIQSLKGIEYFTQLTELDCSYNKINSLNISNNTALTHLSCFSNQLSTLDVGKNTALIELWCNGNMLSSLDISRNTTLTSLNVSIR